MENRDPLFSIFITFLLLILVFIHNAAALSDAEALLALKSSIDPLNTLQWRGNDACKWQGIRKCMNGRVTKLVLEHLNLSGSMEDNSLNQLDQLRVLSFKDNSISGQIPNLSALVNLKSLYLNDNNFSGEFPAYITSFHRLKVISLSGNKLSGKIPHSLVNLQRLYMLHLQNNEFTGDIPPLNQISLRFLNLSNNQLTGEIPVTSALIQFNASSFSGNINLCGEQINNPCEEYSSFAPELTPFPRRTIGKSKRQKLIAIICGSVGGFLLLCTLLLFIIICRRRRNEEARRRKRPAGGEVVEMIGGGGGGGNGSNNEEKGGFSWEGGGGVGSLVFCGAGDMSYSLEELLKASAETLGRGTVGSTYKAVMESGFIVTVKRLKDAKYPRVEDFVRHVEIIGQLRHPNLVPLRAYFQAREERLLVYDYFPNGSLFSLIHGTRSSSSGKPLHWTSCLKIADDLAAALLYIHQHPAGLTHGNLKSSNVLLGPDFESCLTDYSLTPLLNPDSLEDSTSASSLFYRAPECRHRRTPLTQQADIYSFGILLLELLTGQTPFRDLIEDHGLDIPNWVRSVREEETESGEEPGSSNEGSEEKLSSLLNIAMACVAVEPENRPVMTEVMRMVRLTRSEAHASSNSSDLSAGRWSDTVQSLPRQGHLSI